MNRPLCFFLLLILAAASLASRGSAQALTTLHSFGDGSVANDGFNPNGLILGRDGNFYGTTSAGGGAGINASGTVFKMTPTGTITILHIFTPKPNAINSDGADPVGSLVQGSDGNFYGTTELGGSAGKGVVYKITSSGTFTTLHNFGDGTVANDGNGSSAALVQGTDGNFYGTTYAGGSTVSSSFGGLGYGTVFKIASTGAYTVLHDFGDGSVANDGTRPYAALDQGRDENFYGTTYAGGANNFGTVFKMTPTGTVTILYQFEGTADGDEPYAALVQGRDGNFYGTTPIGSSSVEDGTVFKITPAGAITILHSFGDGAVNDGYCPNSLMQGTDGNFYGTTTEGGVSGGTVFKMTPTGAITTLVNFNNTDGAEPEGDLVQFSDGSFYGTTAAGGSTIASDPNHHGYGTAFRLSTSLSGTPLTITSLSPASTAVGGGAFSLAITGTNFTGNSTVTFAGTPVTVTARASTQLTVTVPASAITNLGTKTVVISDPANGLASIIFTVTQGWSARDVAAVSDGTSRLLWDRGDGAAGIWIMSANNTQTLAGPTYGPYTGWTAQDITAASDGTSRILWNRYDGATGVWAMDAHGNQTSVSPTFGPFSGWKAIDLTAAPDGTSRLMWRYTNGQAGLLSLSATGTQVVSGRSYGPYTGWTATAVGAAGDGTARMLWTRSDGAMGLWTMDAGDFQASVGPTYGPYSDSHGHWTATDLSTSADGTSCVLWKRSDGAVGVWSFSASNVQTLAGPVYGPYTGWTAAALDAASDKARVLWVRSDRVAGVWSFGPNDVESLIGPLYGPY